MRNCRSLNTSVCMAAVLGMLAAACSTSAQPARQMSPAEVVATVDGAPITLSEVDAVALQQPVTNFGSARLVQALYLARRAALEEMVASRLIDREAKARGVSATDLTRQEVDAKVTAATDADVEFWYQTNPSAVQGRALAQLREPIRSLLNEQRTMEQRDRLIEALRAKTPVTVSLDIPRQQIATAGHPSRGPANAPIEIVEFSDFQCPFCQRANPTVEQVLKVYGDKVKFVYRHYPLPNHPNAKPAAEASVCADQQGQFWKYHDRLFASPDKLTDADLKSHAAALGLDAAAFNSCFDAGTGRSRVEQDMKDATEAGVSATPSFFINGRSLEGAQPFEAFRQIIDEELAK
jgi:protein-disulfide isomerase